MYSDCDLFSLQISSLEYPYLHLILNFIVFGSLSLEVIPFNLQMCESGLLIAVNVTFHTLWMPSELLCFC